MEEHFDGSVCTSAYCFLDDAINQRTIEKSAIKEIGGNRQKKELIKKILISETADLQGLPSSLCSGQPKERWGRACSCNAPNRSKHGCWGMMFA